MPIRRPRIHPPRRLVPATLLALCAGLCLAASLATATTLEFRATASSGSSVDLELPPAKLGIQGTVKFQTTAADRKGLAAARQAQRLRDLQARSVAAATRASVRIEAIRALLAEAQDDEQRLRQAIQARMVERYKAGESGDIAFLLQGDGLSDLVTRGRILQDQSARDRRQFDAYEAKIAQIETYQRVLEELRDIHGERAQRLDERAVSLDAVLVASQVGHDEAPDPEGKQPKGIKGTWYIMDGAFSTQLFLPNTGSNYGGGIRTPARKATPAEIATVLADKRIDLDASGYNDVLTGQIDGRLLNALTLAANQFQYVRVTSLKSDHGVYTASGNVSEHSYGCAADIGTIGQTLITPSAQVPGSQVEQAVRFFMSLPGDLSPHQVISLFDLGGASLAMGDHGDHIHLGFSC